MSLLRTNQKPTKGENASAVICDWGVFLRALVYGTALGAFYWFYPERDGTNLAVIWLHFFLSTLVLACWRDCRPVQGHRVVVAAAFASLMLLVFLLLPIDNHYVLAGLVFVAIIFYPMLEYELGCPSSTDATTTATNGDGAASTAVSTRTVGRKIPNREPMY